MSHTGEYFVKGNTLLCVSLSMLEVNKCMFCFIYVMVHVRENAEFPVHVSYM